MDPLPPIPVPPALRWREFRIRFLPVLFFLAALGGVWFIWQNNISAPTLVGAVETRTAQIVCPYPGKISELNISRFQTVRKGEPLAVIVPNDPRSALDVIQSELGIINARFGTPIDEQRGRISYEQLRESWLQQKVDLATARVNLQLARDEMDRYAKLFEQKLVSVSTNEIAQKTEEALEAEVFERSNLVVIVQSKMEELALSDPQHSSEDKTLAKALDVEEEKLKIATASTESVTLTAPIDGMVNDVYRQAGENVMDGDLILTISAVEPEHIISYLREPIPFEPKAGLTMEVRTRSLHVKTGMARIEHVGSEFESITNSLRVVRPGVPVDLGLPVEISMPPGLEVRPGEIVDLTLLSQK
jgi:multidrug resistance efflux pump